jgi:hypothetical protein
MRATTRGLARLLAGTRARPPVGEEETMTDPWAVLAGLAAIGFLFVLVPVVATVYLGLRAPRWLRCPEAQVLAGVAVDAGRAAWTAAFGQPRLRVRDCTLWPERAGCAQHCCELPEIAGHAEPARPEPAR